MPRLSGNSILVPPAEDPVLNRLTGAQGTPQKLFTRVRLILLAAGGTGVREIAGRFGSEVDHRFLVAARLESDSAPSGASA